MPDEPKKPLDARREALLEEFLVDAAADKRQGITLGVVYRAVRDVATAQAASDKRIVDLEEARREDLRRFDRHGKRLKRLEESRDIDDGVERTGNHVVDPVELDKALEVRTALNAKVELDTERLRKFENDRYFRRALLGAVITLCIAAIAGCSAYVASRVHLTVEGTPK